MCGPLAAVAASTFAPNEAVQVLNHIGFRTTTTNRAMARRKGGVGGADDEGRAVGRAGHERVHVGGGFVQRERHEQLLCVPHSVRGISEPYRVQKSPPPGMR